MENLSLKEQEVLPYVTRGLRNSRIATILYVSKDTVKAHIGSIMRKCHVTNRTELAFYVFKKKIINIDDLDFYD